MLKGFPREEMVKLTIDGRPVEVRPGELVIKAAEDNGVYIPRFCWHPRMASVGMCRMCLVEVDTPRGKALITACTEPVAEGMQIETTSEVVKKAQEGVLEFLLANHPLDCPVCDKGGECPLQDQAMSYGPGESRFVEEKRHFEKPIPISDLVLLDRERCILCARCTRFADEIAGDPLIEFLDRGNFTQINTFPDRPFSSYFSGNTVQICPVGALTATSYRFKARPWDLQMVESTCANCTTGDRVAVHASHNQVVRVVGVDSDATNHGWLSDKCRFGVEYLGSPDRLTVPLIRNTAGHLAEASWAEALTRVAESINAAKSAQGADSVAAIGGARGTNEDAYALSKFMRVAVGSNNLDAQLGDGLDPRFLAATADRATINQLDSAGSILVWGADLKEEHPTLYLRVRRAVRERGAKLVVVHPRRTGLDDLAIHKVTYRPGSGAEVLETLRDGTFPESRLLKRGSMVAIVGKASIGEDPRLPEAVAHTVRTKYDANILPLARRSNIFGALDMGVAPILLPGRVAVSDPGSFADAWGLLPATPGMDTAAILGAAAEGRIEVLMLVGADPLHDFPNHGVAKSALDGAGLLVSIDLFLNDSNAAADVILPADGFAEKEGTVTNLEGRVQKVNRLVPGPGQSRPDWSIFEDLAARMGVELGFENASGIAKEIGEVAPAYRGVTWELLEWERREGVVAPLAEVIQPLQYVPTDSPGDVVDADLVLHSARVMYDAGILLRKSPSVAHLAPGGFVAMHPEDIVERGLRPGATVKVLTSQGQASLPLRVDDSLLRGVVFVPANQPGVPSLGSALAVQVLGA